MAVLRCEMARKNMFIKDEGMSNKRQRTTGGYGDSSYGAGPSYRPPPVQPQGYAPVSNIGDNAPCNTLFIGNLSDSVDEAELRGLFSHQPGFMQMKLVRGTRNTSAFVEFAGDKPSG